MTRRLAALSLLLLASAGAAQAPPAPAVQQRLAALSSRLGQCHHGVVLRLARTPLTPAQIADRAMTACASREAPIRAFLVQQIGPQRANAVMQTQRAHWREVVGRLVLQTRLSR
jgi:hypothetical protein